MGTSVKKMIFDEHIQEGLAGWAQGARMRVGQRADNYQTGPSHFGPKDQGEFLVEEGNARLFRRNTSKLTV